MSTITPISKQSRIEVLDIIRGFAILGIVIANIHSWSGYKYISFDVLSTLPYYEYNDTLRYFFNMFIDTKFYTLFSMLFGVGFYLQFHKFRADQAPFMKVYRRRLGYLMLFGFLHGLIWSGDILFLYGSVGFMLVLFRNVSHTKLLVYAILLYYSWLAYDFVFAEMFSEPITYASYAYKQYSDQSPEALTLVMQEGSIFEVWKQNLHNVYWRYYDFLPSGRVTKVLGIFMLGYWLMSIDYFRRYADSIKLLVLYAVIGIGMTYIALEIGGSMSKWSHSLKDVAYKSIMVTGQIFMAMMYVNLLSILYNKTFLRPIIDVFAPVGRMSFTNYLLHTLIGIAIFYNFAGDLWGTMGLVQITLVALSIYAFEVVFSYWWQKYFTFGPLEWVWRSLTYKTLFAIRKKV